jgi:hypothetical protein
MFFTLVRRDHTTHYGLYWLPVAAPIGVIAAALGKEGISPSTDGDFVGPVLLIWVMVTMMLGFAQVGRRADRYVLSLPLPSRTVWLARLTSVVAFMIFILAVAVVFMLAFNDQERQPLINGDAVGFLLSLFGVMLLAVALVQSYRPKLLEIPGGRRAVAYIVTVWAVCLGLLFSLISMGPAWTVLPLLVAIALLVRVGRSLPATFTVATARSADDRGVPSWSPETSTEAALRSASERDGPSRPGWLLTRTILLSLYRPVAAAVAVAVVLGFLGFYISGFYPEPLSGPVYMFWVIGFSPAMIIWPAKHVFRLDFLPVTRRRIFPFLALPALVLLCGGFVGGTVFGYVFTPREALREYVGTEDCPFCHRVPDRFLKIAWDGAPPPVVAPWGESHQPWTCRPIEGRRSLLYSPFSVPKGSSKEYAAWQLSREIDAVYGADIPAENILRSFDAYFETREDGTFALRSWGDPIRADYPGLRQQDWGRPTAAIVLILGIMWFMMAGWMVRVYFSGVSPSFVSLVGRVLPAAIPIVLVAIMILLGEYGYTTSWKLTAMANILVRSCADLLPPNPFATWGVVIVVLASAYLLAERVFRNAQTGGQGYK